MKMFCNSILKHFNLKAQIALYVTRPLNFLQSATEYGLDRNVSVASQHTICGDSCSSESSLLSLMPEEFQTMLNHPPLTRQKKNKGLFLFCHLLVYVSLIPLPASSNHMLVHPT